MQQLSDTPLANLAAQLPGGFRSWGCISKNRIGFYGADGTLGGRSGTCAAKKRGIKALMCRASGAEGDVGLGKEAKERVREEFVWALWPLYQQGSCQGKASQGIAHRTGRLVLLHYHRD